MSRLKLYAGHYSTHLGWCLGIRFETSRYGGYSVAYGWPQNEWMIVVSIGRQSWCAGVYLPAKARAERRAE